MKGEKDLRSSAKGRFRQASRYLEEVRPILVKQPRAISDAEMAALRNAANGFGQCVHEFNAFRNALEWNDKEKSHE